MFLSHTWRPDGLGRNTHFRVASIHDALVQRGVATWFDEDVGLAHDIDGCMAEGIDRCDVFVVFVTRAYCEKVEKAARNPRNHDNCYKEFSYAHCMRRLFVPVVFEPSILDDWPAGIVKMHCGSKMHVDGALRPASEVAEDIVSLTRRLLRRDPPPKKKAPERTRLPKIPQSQLTRRGSDA